MVSCSTSLIRSGGREREEVSRAGSILVATILASIQSILGWVVVARLDGLKGPLIPSVLLVVLGSAVGIALSVLVATRVARRLLVGVACIVIMLTMWLFGGGPGTLPQAFPSARAVANFVPSRWIFEGLLLLEADARPSLATAAESNSNSPPDFAEAYFPARTERMGLMADLWAMVLLLVGLSASAAYLIWVASPDLRTAAEAP